MYAFLKDRFLYFKELLGGWLKKREREEKKYLPSADSPPKWLQWPRLGLAKVRNQKLLSNLPQWGRDLSTWAICC